MKKVLIVDDDSATRGLLSHVLKPYADNFDILTAENGQEAVGIIENNKIDLVITDIKMPVMDGFEFIANLSNNHPEIPIFVMTAFGTSEIESKVKSFTSTTRYFDKPLNMDILPESILEELDSGAEGLLHGISLASFLQLIEMEKKTCTLIIKSNKKSGALYFIKGELITVESGETRNEKALCELLCWDNVKIEIINHSKKKKKEIKQPLMNILMEGLKIKDEMKFEKKPKTHLKPLTDFTYKKKFSKKNEH